MELEGERTLGLHPLVELDSLSDSYVRRVLGRYRNDALYRGYLWNADQTVFAVHGHLPESWNHDRKRSDVEAALTVQLDSLAVDGARMAFSGIPVFRSRSPRLLQADILVFLGGGLVLAFGVLWMVLRRVPLVLLCLASVVAAYLCTLGVMTLVGKPITMLTSFIPIVVLVVGVSDSIHIVERFKRSLSESPTASDGIVSTFADMAMPCFYTSLTTAVGFASLIGTRMEIVIDFGLFTALAIVLTYAFSMTLLPVLLATYAKPHVVVSATPNPPFAAIVEASVRHARRPSPTTAVAFIVIGIVCLAAGPSIADSSIPSLLAAVTERRKDCAPSSPNRAKTPASWAIARISASGRISLTSPKAAAM